jgi:hypothetical protein
MLRHRLREIDPHIGQRASNVISNSFGCVRGDAPPKPQSCNQLAVVNRASAKGAFRQTRALAISRDLAE